MTELVAFEGSLPYEFNVSVFCCGEGNYMWRRLVGSRFRMSMMVVCMPLVFRVSA